MEKHIKKIKSTNCFQNRNYLHICDDNMNQVCQLHVKSKIHISCVKEK